MPAMTWVVEHLVQQRMAVKATPAVTDGCRWCSRLSCLQCSLQALTAASCAHLRDVQCTQAAQNADGESNGVAGDLTSLVKSLADADAPPVQLSKVRDAGGVLELTILGRNMSLQCMNGRHRCLPLLSRCRLVLR